VNHRPIEKMYRHALNAPGLSLKFRQRLRDEYNNLRFLAPEILEQRGWDDFMRIVNNEFPAPEMTLSEDELQFIKAVTDDIPLQEYPDLSMKEILDETIKYYSSHPRGLSFSGECVYIAAYDESCLCAVGRACIAPRMDWGGSVRYMYRPVGTGSDKISIENELKPQYRGHTVGFWARIQFFHDQTRYWTDFKTEPKTPFPQLGMTNLSEEGVSAAKEIYYRIEEMTPKSV